jgi:hypothetical protein
MKFLFTKFIKHGVSHQVVFLEQTILKKSSEYKGFVILLLPARGSPPEVQVNIIKFQHIA